MFQNEKLRCIEATKGSVILHLEGQVNDISKTALKVLSDVTDIAGHSITGFHVCNFLVILFTIQHTTVVF